MAENREVAAMGGDAAPVAVQAVQDARAAPVLRLIGVSSGYGVPPATRDGSTQAAQALHLADVGHGVRRNRVACSWDEPLSLADAAGLSREEALRRISSLLEERIVAAVLAGRPRQRVIPVVLSGDHAIAHGAWRGVARTCTEKPGLLWIDAHLDAHTSLSTPSGNLHGMPLAALLGCMPNPWQQEHPVIEAGRTCVFGARSFESAELRLLQRLDVRIFGMEEIRQRGLSATFAEALARVGGAAGGSRRQPFGISLDLDALDPRFAHGVNTPVADGLDADALLEAVRGLAHRENFVGFEVSEYNPQADADRQTAAFVMRLLASLTLPVR